VAVRVAHTLEVLEGLLLVAAVQGLLLDQAIMEPQTQVVAHQAVKLLVEQAVQA
jgi:hypothetical protein